MLELHIHFYMCSFLIHMYIFNSKFPWLDTTHYTQIRKHIHAFFMILKTYSTNYPQFEQYMHDRVVQELCVQYMGILNSTLVYMQVAAVFTCVLFYTCVHVVICIANYSSYLTSYIVIT